MMKAKTVWNVGSHLYSHMADCWELHYVVNAYGPVGEIIRYRSMQNSYTLICCIYPSISIFIQDSRPSEYADTKLYLFFLLPNKWLMKGISQEHMKQ
jgi:hypothetical protein